MAKEIICVYQDCVMCGDRGKRLQKHIEKEGINLRKVSFASPEGKEVCAEAVFNRGIGTMPFFTDGVKFSARIEDFAETTQESVHNTTKSIHNTVKSVKKPRKSVKKSNKKVKIEEESE